jgi:hypothetical protein
MRLAMSEAKEICDEIQKALPDLTPGTLRFWGAWFGRPYDGFHKIFACEQNQDVLTLHIDKDSQLKIWAPHDLQLGNSMFRIKNADRVRWEWSYVKRRQTGRSRYFFEFVRTGDTVVGSSDVDWFEPNLKTDVSFPAAEIVSLVMPRL